jgi:hypothetical protein
MVEKKWKNRLGRALLKRRGREAKGVLKTIFKSKRELAAAVLAAAAMIGLGISLFLHYSWAAEQEGARDNAEAEKLKGEWSFTATRDQPDDTEIVWTFRPNGVFRIDGIDRKTRKQVKGLVGLWSVEKGDLHLVEEVWNDKYLCPMQTREWLRIPSVSETELVLQPLEASVYRMERKPLEFKRFAGWPSKPDSEGPSALKAFVESFRRLAK